MGPAMSDYNMWLILLSVIQLSGGHCINSPRQIFLVCIIVIEDAKPRLFG